MRRKKKTQVPDEARLPSVPLAEVKAVQVERSVVVQTPRGECLATPGQWLVTHPDGSVRVVTDQVFRLQTLRQELLQVILRNQTKARKRA